jgi:hypothetical protein
VPNSNRQSGGKSNRSGSGRAAPGAGSKNKYAERHAAKQAQRQAELQARRRRNLFWGMGIVGLVIVIVVVLVIVKVGGGGNGSGSAGSSTSPPAGTPIPVALTGKLGSIPLSELTSASTGGLTTSPQTIRDPALTANGKPDLLYIGAEFCPVCATERWAMYVALSKFGAFDPQPGQIHSAIRDGDIPTLTFYKTTYTSPYLSFTPVETTTNQPEGNYYVTLQTPTAAQQKLWIAHTGQSFPWLDFGGKKELTSAQFDPSTLEGLTFSDIAADVGNNSTAIGTDIDAAAKVFVRTICTNLTDNQPADVCKSVGNG